MKTALHLPRPILKSNRPVAILAQAEYESLIETIEVLSDQPLLKRIASALNNLHKGRFFRHDEIFPNKH